jgi:hypothetical protein
MKNYGKGRLIFPSGEGSKGALTVPVGKGATGRVR